MTDAVPTPLRAVPTQGDLFVAALVFFAAGAVGTLIVLCLSSHGCNQWCLGSGAPGGSSLVNDCRCFERHAEVTP